MSTPRAALVEALAGIVPAGVVVLGYARDATVTKPTVMVRVDNVTPSRPAPRTHRVYGYTLLLVVPYTDTEGAADDELDALLEDVLQAIETATGTLPMWKQATRAVYEPPQQSTTTLPAYELTLEVTHRKVDPNA